MKNLILSFFLLSVISSNIKAQVIVDSLFQQNNSLELNDKTLKNKLLFFFKSDCSSCRQQAKDFNCLEKNQVISIGFSSDLKSLQKEARLMGLKDQVFYASSKVVKAFNLTNGYSPVLFAFNKEGKSKSWLGVKNCQEFTKFLADTSK